MCDVHIKQIVIGGVRLRAVPENNGHGFDPLKKTAREIGSDVAKFLL